MKQLLIILSLFVSILAPSISIAFHSEDYFVEIGDGYQILTPNKLSHYVVTRDGTIVLATKDYPGVGPIVRYCFHDKYIILLNYGRTTGTNSEGSETEVINTRERVYFTIDKTSNEVIGPLSKTQLDSYNFVNNSFDWLRVKPYHPGKNIKEIIGILVASAAIAALFIAIL
ncbi:MAG: hypothetical protein ACM34I_06515 [bacterium]